MPDGWSETSSGRPLTKVDEEKVSRPSDRFKMGMKVRNRPTDETFFVAGIRHKDVGMKVGTDRICWFPVTEVEILDDSKDRREHKEDPGDTLPAEESSD